LVAVVIVNERPPVEDSINVLRVGLAAKKLAAYTDVIRVAVATAFDALSVYVPTPPRDVPDIAVMVVPALMVTPAMTVPTESTPDVIAVTVSAVVEIVP